MEMNVDKQSPRHYAPIIRCIERDGNQLKETWVAADGAPRERRWELPAQDPR